MNLPFVSRARFEDAKKQIADLKEANKQLLTIALSKPTLSMESEAEPEPQKPHRKLGAELRREFRIGAEARAAEAKANKGAAK
jgi:hypothetical protein